MPEPKVEEEKGGNGIRLTGGFGLDPKAKFEEEKGGYCNRSIPTCCVVPVAGALT